MILKEAENQIGLLIAVEDAAQFALGSLAQNNFSVFHAVLCGNPSVDIAARRLLKQNHIPVEKFQTASQHIGKKTKGFATEKSHMGRIIFIVPTSKSLLVNNQLGHDAQPTFGSKQLPKKQKFPAR